MLEDGKRSSEPRRVYQSLLLLNVDPTKPTENVGQGCSCVYLNNTAHPLVYSFKHYTFLPYRELLIAYRGYALIPTTVLQCLSETRIFFLKYGDVTPQPFCDT